MLLHPTLPLVGVSMWMERGCQQNGRALADGSCGPPERELRSETQRRAQAACKEASRRRRRRRFADTPSPSMLRHLLKGEGGGGGGGVQQNDSLAGAPFATFPSKFAASYLHVTRERQHLSTLGQGPRAD